MAARSSRPRLTRPPSPPPPQDAEKLQSIRALITSYFNIVRKKIRDVFPKIILHSLVEKSKDALLEHLVCELALDPRRQAGM